MDYISNDTGEPVDYPFENYVIRGAPDGMPESFIPHVERELKWEGWKLFKGEQRCFLEDGLSCSLLRLHNPDTFDFELEDDGDDSDYIDNDIDDECEAMDHIMNFKVPSRPTV